MKPGHLLAVFMTGDGGWATLDRHVASELAKNGVAVIGLNSREYLGHEKSPDQVGLDMTRLARHYMTMWNRDSLIIAGYSRGADLAPFVVTRLPADLRKKVVLVAMLGLSHDAGFEFHLIDMVASPRRKSDRSTLEELAKLSGVKLMCVYGAQEDDSACRDAPTGMMTQRIQLQGGHHFDNDYYKLGDLILEASR
jgi:type IV secretory pathway VirJ component